MNAPGRDALGRWVTDDRNLVDAMTSLCAAVAPVLAFMADPAMDAPTRIDAAYKGFEALAETKTILEYVDVGEKPGKDTA